MSEPPNKYDVFGTTHWRDKARDYIGIARNQARDIRDLRRRLAAQEATIAQLRRKIPPGYVTRMLHDRLVSEAEARGYRRGVEDVAEMLDEEAREYNEGHDSALLQHEADNARALTGGGEVETCRHEWGDPDYYGWFTCTKCGEKGPPWMFDPRIEAPDIDSSAEDEVEIVAEEGGERD